MKYYKSSHVNTKSFNDIHNSKKYFLEIFKLGFILLLSSLVFSGCEKLVEIPTPRDRVTDVQVFGSEQDVTSALMGIYSDMSYASNSLQFGNGAISIFTGLSSDELNVFNRNVVNSYQFQMNTILASNPSPDTYFWSPIYSSIYKTNALIQGIQVSSALNNDFKAEIIAEAKFIRAFCNFYLVNLFGDIPLVNTISWEQNRLLNRTPKEKVYDQILSDLKEAENNLPNDYSFSNSEKIRANKWAAKALLARIYLYLRDWPNAASKATEVINSGLFFLEPNLNSVFIKNNSEAILQLQTANSGRFATQEGFNLIPTSHTSSPSYYMTSSLLNAFETGDNRRKQWVDSTKYQNVIYYYPSKYKVRQGTSGNINEYYELLRLAEMYLIRAEATLNNNGNIPDIVADLNIIRNRAGLGNLSSTLQRDLVNNALIQEKRIEFFCEIGNRWFDLKRWGIATTTLSSNKGIQVQENSLLYPIPFSEIQNDPNLTQNPGY